MHMASHATLKNVRGEHGPTWSPRRKAVSQREQRKLERVERAEAYKTRLLLSQASFNKSQANYKYLSGQTSRKDVLGSE